MRASDLPSYSEVELVLAAHRHTVSAGETDGNGHMNVRHIYAHGVEGADATSEAVGIDDAYRATVAQGTFAAEHHITYRSEIHQASEIAARPVWVDRSERAAHLLVFITNETTRELSAVLEMIVVNMDLSSRRPSPFPAAVAARIDIAISATSALGIAMPLSGAMRVRRS